MKLHLEISMLDQWKNQNSKLLQTSEKNVRDDKICKTILGKKRNSWVAKRLQEVRICKTWHSTSLLKETLPH